MSLFSVAKNWHDSEDEDGRGEGPEQGQRVVFGGGEGGEDGGEEEGQGGGDPRLPIGIVEACRTELARGSVSRIVMQPSVAIGRGGRQEGDCPLPPEDQEVVWDVECVGWNDVVDVLELDNRPGAVLVKHMYAESEKFSSDVEDGCLIKLTIRGFLTNSDGHITGDHLLEDGSFVEIYPNRTWEGVVGDGGLPEGVELGLVSFKLGQSGIVHIRDPTLASSFEDPGGWGAVERIKSGEFKAVEWHFTVQDFTPCQDMSLDQKLKSAERRKLYGNLHYRNGDYALAIAKYEHAEALICLETEGERVQDLRFSMALNRAACLIKQGEYKDALQECNDALEIRPGCAKAYHRRGLAKAGLGREDEACIDLKKALEIQPGIAQASRLIRDIEKRSMMRGQEDSKGRKVYSNMFSGKQAKAKDKIGAEDMKEVAEGGDGSDLNPYRDADPNLMRQISSNSTGFGPVGDQSSSKGRVDGGGNEVREQPHLPKTAKSLKRGFFASSAESGCGARPGNSSVLERRTADGEGDDAEIVSMLRKCDLGGEKDDKKNTRNQKKREKERKAGAEKNGTDGVSNQERQSDEPHRFPEGSVLRRSKHWNRWVSEGKVAPA